MEPVANGHRYIEHESWPPIRVEGAPQRLHHALTINVSTPAQAAVRLGVAAVAKAGLSALRLGRSRAGNAEQIGALDAREFLPMLFRPDQRAPSRSRSCRRIRRRARFEALARARRAPRNPRGRRPRPREWPAYELRARPRIIAHLPAPKGVHYRATYPAAPREVGTATGCFVVCRQPDDVLAGRIVWAGSCRRMVESGTAPDARCSAKVVCMEHIAQHEDPRVTIHLRPSDPPGAARVAADLAPTAQDSAGACSGLAVRADRRLRALDVRGQTRAIAVQISWPRGESRKFARWRSIRDPPCAPSAQ